MTLTVNTNMCQGTSKLVTLTRNKTMCQGTSQSVLNRALTDERSYICVPIGDLIVCIGYSVNIYNSR